MSELLRVKKLSKTYQHGTTSLTVLRDLDFELKAGEFVAIVGASGSGKSTLLHLLGTLDLPTSGQVTLGGSDYTKLDTTQLADVRNKKIGFVFQFHHLLPEFTALENVLIPSFIAGADRKQSLERAEYLLECLGLSDRIKHKPSELSGGEQQRVAVARALANNPLLLLMDEPTGNLDRANGERLFALIQDVQKKMGVSAVMVTHNPVLAEQTSRTYLLRDGKLTVISENGAESILP